MQLDTFAMPDKAAENMAPDSSGQEWFKLIISFLVVVILVFSVLLGKLFYENIGEVTPTPTPGDTEKELSNKVGTTNLELLPAWHSAAKSKDPKKRMVALRGLQYYGISQAPQLLPLLQDPDQKIRTAAIQTLGNLRFLPALPAILKSARSEKKMGYQILCIQAMGKICQSRSRLTATHGAIQFLMELVQGNNHALRRYGHIALQEISGTQLKSSYSEKRKVQHWEEWFAKVTSKK